MRIQSSSPAEFLARTSTAQLSSAEVSSASVGSISICCSADSQFALVTYVSLPAAVYQWDLSTRCLIGRYESDHLCITHCIAAHRRPWFCTCDSTDSPTLWELHRVPVSRPRERHLCAVVAVAFFSRELALCGAADTAAVSLVAAGSADGAVLLWDCGSARSVASFSLHKERSIAALALCPAVAETETETETETEDPQWPHLLQLASSSLAGTTWLTCFSLALAAAGDGVRVCVRQGRSQSLEGHGDTVRCIAYSLAASLHTTFLATGSDDNCIKIWRAADGSLVASLLDHHDCISALAWSPDGSKLASGSGR
jgi:WD40 repeat protein